MKMLFYLSRMNESGALFYLFKIHVTNIRKYLRVEILLDFVQLTLGATGTILLERGEERLRESERGGDRAAFVFVSRSKCVFFSFEPQFSVFESRENRRVKGRFARIPCRNVIGRSLKPRGS